MPVFLDLKEVSPAVFGRAHIGRTTEGTLGRVSSTVANRARRSVGGGVLIKFIKLAAGVIASSVPKRFPGRSTAAKTAVFRRMSLQYNTLRQNKKPEERLAPLLPAFEYCVCS